MAGNNIDILGFGQVIILGYRHAFVITPDCSAIGIKGHFDEAGRGSAVVDIVQVHIGFHHAAVVVRLAGVPFHHGPQEIRTLELRSHSPLDTAGTAEPSRTILGREHDQGVMLVLAQRQLVGIGKVVHCLVHGLEILPQSLVSGVLFQALVFRTMGALLGALGAVAHIAVHTAFVIGLELLDDGNSGFADRTRGSGCRHRNQAQKHGQR